MIAFNTDCDAIQMLFVTVALSVGQKGVLYVIQNAYTISFDPGSSNWYWVPNEEVEKLQDGEINNAAAWRQCSEKEIVEPVEDIDKEERRGESSASVAINVVWIFHSED